MKKIVSLGASSILVLGLSLGLAGTGNTALPQVDPAYVKECGACHIP